LDGTNVCGGGSGTSAGAGGELKKEGAAAAGIDGAAEGDIVGAGAGGSVGDIAAGLTPPVIDTLAGAASTLVNSNPHSSQKREPASFQWWQLGHSIFLRPSGGKRF